MEDKRCQREYFKSTSPVQIACTILTTVAHQASVMTSSRNGLIVTILVVLIVVGITGYGLWFLISKLAHVVQKTRENDAEEAERAEAEESTDFTTRHAAAQASEPDPAAAAK